MKALRQVLLVVSMMLPYCGAARGDIITAHLTLQSQPGDFVGMGGNFDISYHDNAFGQVVRPPAVIGKPEDLIFNAGMISAEAFTIQIGTDALGIPIQPGTYTGAVRDIFMGESGHPGLSVAFQSRGCNTDTGSFTIQNVAFGPNNMIASFGASFEQHCEGAAPALFGTFTYQNLSVTAVPEPSTCLLLTAALGALVFPSVRCHLGLHAS